MAEGTPPYSDLHPIRAIFKMQKIPPEGLKNPNKWSNSFVNFVKRCLIVNSEQRPDANELLNDNFFSTSKNSIFILFLIKFFNFYIKSK